MRKDSRRVGGQDQISGGHDSVGRGALVVATLNNPREKFWGMVMGLAPEGISLRGIELASLEDLAAMVKEGEKFAPGVVFFPMHRVERVELDQPAGNLPSLAQRFSAATRLDAVSFLTPAVGADELGSGSKRRSRIAGVRR